MRRRSHALSPLSDVESGARLSVTILVALMAALVLVPIGVQAATSLVTIQDPTDTSAAGAAKVVGNKLEVGDGSGSLTVDGTVSTKATLPSTAWTFQTSLSGGLCRSPCIRALFLPPTATTKLAIGSITVTNVSDPSTVTGGGSVTVSVRNTCTDPATTLNLETVSVPLQETSHLAFPVPLVVTRAGTAWCVNLGADNGTFAVTGVGWYVP